MKTLFLFVLTFISLNVFAQYPLETNIRIVKDDNSQLFNKLEYKITNEDNLLTFDCKNCEINFNLELIELIQKDTVEGYEVIVYSTTNTDEVAFCYNDDGNLDAISIKKNENMSIIYMYSNLFKQKEDLEELVETQNSHKL